MSNPANGGAGSGNANAALLNDPVDVIIDKLLRYVVWALVDEINGGLFGYLVATFGDRGYSAFTPYKIYALVFCQGGHKCDLFRGVFGVVRIDDW